MKHTLILVAVLMATIVFADTIPFDSTKLHNQIVNTANVVITSIPDASPAVSIVKVVLIAIGSTITGFFIGFFKKRNAKK